MTDENVSQSQILLQPHHQAHNLCLDGHIQGGDDLVAHQKRGAEGQCPGDVDALPLTAGELMGKPVGKLGVQPHQQEHPLRQLIQLRPAHSLVHPLDVVSLQDNGPH